MRSLHAIAPRRFALLPLAFVLALGLVVRLVYLYQIRTIPFFDSPTVDGRFYDQWAQSIAGIGGGTEAEGVFFLAPAYPYFLALLYSLFGWNLLVVHVVQMVLGAASCALVCAAGRRWFGARAGLIAGLLLCFYAPAIFFDGVLHKGCLLLFLASLLLYLLSLAAQRADWRVLLLCGLVSAMLALTQENMLVLLLIVPLWIGLGDPFAPHQRQLRLAGVFLGGALPLLLLVAARNYAVGSVFALTTTNVGQNFYIGSHEGADGLYQSFLPGRQDPHQERADAARIAEQSAGRKLNPAEVSAFWFQRGLQFVREQPGAWLALLGRKALLAWNRFEAPDAEDIETYSQWSPLLSALHSAFHFGVLAPLGLAGLVLTCALWRRLWVLYVLVFAITVSVALFFVFARFRLPLVPILVIGAGAGVASLGQLLAARRRAWMALGACTALASAGLVNWPMVNEGAYHSVGLVNLGSLLRQKGRLDEAAHFLERAVAEAAENELAWHQLGLVEQASGRFDEARAHFEKAAALRPDFADPHLALGRMAVGAKRPEDAVARYRRAIALRPDEPTPRLELARVLVELGRREEAVREYRLLVQLSPNDPSLAEELRKVADSETVPAAGDQGELERWLSSAADAAAVGRYAAAIRDYEKALELSPKNVPAHFGLAKACLASGDHARAIEYFRRTLELDDGHVLAHIELGRLLADQGRLESAVEHYRKALAADPTAIPARYNLATALAAMGRFDEAIAAMELCLQQAKEAKREELIAWIEDRLVRLRAERGTP